MIFKPDIDFTKLIETGRMSHQDLLPFFGRLPTPQELRWARGSAVAKHPEIEPVIRSCNARGLYLMTDSGAQAFQSRNLVADVTRLVNRTRKIEALPTAQLDSEELKKHDSMMRCSKSLSAHLTQTKKLLPWEK